MLIKEGIYLGTRLSPAFHLFLAPSLPGWGGTWGRARTRGRMDPAPAARRSRPHVLAKLAAKEEKAFFFSPERQENGFQGAIGASLLSPCPKSIQPLPSPRPPYAGVENGPFWNHPAKSTAVPRAEAAPPFSETHPSALTLAWQQCHWSPYLLSFQYCPSAQLECVLDTRLSTRAISRCGASSGLQCPEKSGETAGRTEPSIPAALLAQNSPLVPFSSPFALLPQALWGFIFGFLGIFPLSSVKY